MFYGIGKNQQFKVIFMIFKSRQFPKAK